MTTILKIIVIILVALIGSAWSLMLTVGVLHSDWWGNIPTMGFHAAFVIVLVPTAVITLVKLAVAGLAALSSD